MIAPVTRMDASESGHRGRPALLLASSSPYRRALLERLGLAFACQAPAVDETAIDAPMPALRAALRARAKAEAVAREAPAGTLVIGCDQVAAVDGAVLDKPGTRERAEAQLAAASGRCIELYSAVHVEPVAAAAAGAGECVRARVHLRALSAAEIRRYVALDRPLDCAGSFRIDGRGALLMRRIECPDPGAVVGLPLIALAGLLRRFGLDPLGA